MIGYVTNAIAINIFRPHKEKRLLGIRIPFTPGLSETEGRLAVSIAEMVARELLTADALKPSCFLRGGENLEKELPALQKRFCLPVLTICRNFLPVPGPDRTKESSESIGRILVESIIRSSFIEDTIPGLAEKAIHFVFSLQADRLFSEAGIASVIENLSLWIEGEQGREAVRSVFYSLIRDLKDRRKSLSDLIPLEVYTYISDSLDSFYPSICSFVSSFLNKQETRLELNIRGEHLLSDIINRLNIFQRFLVAAGQYDRTLKDNMPGIVDELISGVEESLHDNSNRTRIIELLKDGLVVVLLKDVKDELARPDLAPTVCRSRPDGLAELAHDRVSESARVGARRGLGGQAGVGAPAAGGRAAEQGDGEECDEDPAHARRHSASRVVADRRVRARRGRRHGTSARCAVSASQRPYL